jgi:hypothetical protein
MIVAVDILPIHLMKKKTIVLISISEAHKVQLKTEITNHAGTADGPFGSCTNNAAGGPCSMVVSATNIARIWKRIPAVHTLGAGQELPPHLLIELLRETMCCTCKPWRSHHHQVEDQNCCLNNFCHMISSE